MPLVGPASDQRLTNVQVRSTGSANQRDALLVSGALRAAVAAYANMKR